LITEFLSKFLYMMSYTIYSLLSYQRAYYIVFINFINIIYDGKHINGRNKKITREINILKAKPK